MFPYSTCMRFNSRKRSSTDSTGNFLPSEWTLVQHFESDTGIAPAFISITSQDDQTLCFNWSLDPELRRESLASLGSLASSVERRESDDGKSVYLFLTLRRKSLQASIHSEAISLLDPCYYGITERYLAQASRWSFNTFSLDLLTGGHSLSALLMYLFKQYRFIETFQLDVINVLRCFYLLEKGYHDTNPYHNSVHAADVTQAMHCFLQEEKISSKLTPMEAMVALLAAVSHDLDHPGVNQSFLVATKSHLAALYNNFSVLESHHWRFALSCFYESHIFDHLSQAQWREIEYLLQHLILATDISRQGEFLVKFRGVVQLGSGFSLGKLEDKHFVLQIALKCADLGNPCRSWKNFSVLESHHWRFALSCFYESHIFDHLSQAQWREIEYLLQHLILATDISRQGEFLVKFRGVVQPGSGFSLGKLEDKHFVLQIALKCADLGNPCRSWKVSQKWSEQICNEFYRQGDFERQLGLPVTSICDRTAMTIPSIQTEFFTNIVRPLFELWNVYLDSKLSRQLLNNLNFNDFMWNTLANEGKLSRQGSGKGGQGQGQQQRCSSVASDRSELSSATAEKGATGGKKSQRQLLQAHFEKFQKGFGTLKRSKSLVVISSTRSLPASLDAVAAELLAEAKAVREAAKKAEAEAAALAAAAATATAAATTTKKCINGCGTPPLGAAAAAAKTAAEIAKQHASAIVVRTAAALEQSSKQQQQELIDEDEDDFVADRFNDDCGAILSTPALLLPNYYIEKSYYSYHRRGSAPGCIDIRKNDLTSNSKTGQLLLLRNTKLKANSSAAKRRSSFPAVKMALAADSSLTGKKSAVVGGGKCRPPKTSTNSYRAAAAAAASVGVPPPISTLFDMHAFSAVHHLHHHHHHHPHHLPYQVILASLGANAAAAAAGGNGGGNNGSSAGGGGGHLNQPRRRSVPQDVFIRSLTNYTA